MTELHWERAGSGRPVVLLHGFTGSTRTWDRLVPDLATAAECIAIDLVGHGQSPAPEDVESYRMPACVADVLGVLDRLGVASADVLGYSMGGRVALHVALEAPERVKGLILESSSPGLDDPLERAARVRADEQLADNIVHDGIAAFVKGWEAQPLLRLDPGVPRAIRRQLHQARLSNRPIGLANSLRGMGAGAHPSAWDRLSELTCRTLLVVGARDPKYCAIAEQMRARLPRAEMVELADAGHTAHLDQPAAFAAAVRSFCGRT